MVQHETESGLTVVSKTLRPSPFTPTKSLTFEQLITRLQGSSFYGLGTQAQDIAYSKIGAAACYTLVSEVNNCISSIVDGVLLLPWDIKRYPEGVRRQDGKPVEGEVVASNDDLQNRHPFQQMLGQFQRENGFDLLGTITMDYTLYGEVFLEIATNLFGYNPRIAWLNPLGVYVDAVGQINSFRYGWNNIYITYDDPQKVAYLHNRNPNDDFTGLPRVLTALDKINILRNLDRFLRDYFINNARPGLIVQPPNNDLSWSGKDYERIKEQVSESIGSGSQFATWVMQRAVQATPLEQPDLVKNEQISEREANALYEVFSVPRAMRGNTSATSYKDGDETTRRFYLDAILPLALRKLQPFINTELMPYYDRSHGLEVFEFDTSQFDMVTAADQLEEQIVTSQVQAGYLPLDEAQRVQERPVDPAMKGRYMVNGLPMRIDQINRLVEATIAQAEAASQIQPQQLFSMPAPPETGANRPAPTETDNMVRRLDAPKKAVVEDDEDDEVDYAHDHEATDWQKSLYQGDPDERDIDERIIKELKQWRSFELRGKHQRDFEPNVLPPWIHHAVIDMLDTCKSKADIDAGFGIIWDNPRVKSVTSYQRGLRELGTGLWRGDLTTGDYINRAQMHITRGLTEAFTTGIERGGLTREDLEDDEYNDLLEAIAQEHQQVPTLADFIDSNNREKGGRLGVIRARSDRWVARYENVDHLGYIVAKRDAKIKWIYDPRREHCTDCARLHGRVYRGKVWRKYGIAPQSSKLQCFGLYCGCKFEETDDPITRGRPPNLVGPR